MDGEIDDLIVSFARLHISLPPLAAPLHPVVAFDRPPLPSHNTSLLRPQDDVEQRPQVVVKHDGPCTTVHRHREERQFVQLSNEQHVSTHNTTTQYQQTVTVSTVVNHIQRVENSNFGANYGNQALVQTPNLSDRRVLDSLPTHPDVSGLLSSYLEDSRSEDIEYVFNWIKISRGLVLWIHAPAGMGKSTFARELAQRLRSGNQLAAALFLSFAPNDWGPETIIRLIAGEIGRTHPRAIPSIADAIENYSGPALPLDVLFDQYIRRPVQSLQLSHPLIILTDAIDEWKTYPTLIKQFTTFDSARDVVKFIILGRAVPSEGDFPGVSVSLYPLPPASKEVISRYFHAHFATIDWGQDEEPEERQVARLAEKANGLFVWAWIVFSTIADDFIDASPKEVLEQTLESRRTTGDSELLAELYHGAIMRSFPRAKERQHVRKYLQATFVLESPLPIADFSRLINMDQRTVERIRKGLYALQTRDPDSSGKLVYPATVLFHLSVTEYFLSSSISGDCAFSICTLEGHTIVGGGCLALLPKFFAGNAEELPPQDALYNYVVLTWPGHVASSFPYLVTVLDAEVWNQIELYGPLQNLTCETVRGWAKALHSALKYSCPSNVACLEEAETGPFLCSVGTELSGDYNMKLVNLGVACLELAVRLLPHTAENWDRLGRAHSGLAELTCSRQSAEVAIAIHRHAVEVVCMDPGANEEAVKRGLAGSLRSMIRCQQLGGVCEELEEAISLGREAMRLEGAEAERAAWLHNLASSIDERFRITRSIEDQEESIALDRAALKLRPEGHRDRARSLTNLALSLKERFGVTTSLDDLEESIVLNRKALELRPEGHRDRAYSLNCLALSLRDRFGVTSCLDDLEESITLDREAMKLQPEGHRDRGLTLNNLAISLGKRFGVTTSLDDLEESITLDREAMKLQPEGHRDRGLTLNNLAGSLKERFGVTTFLDDLEESITLHREALELRPEGHPDRALSLNNLATSLRKYFGVTRCLDDLEESITLSKAAVELRRNGHRDHVPALHNLVISLKERFDVTSSLDDLEESITLLREALGNMNESYPAKYKSLWMLAFFLYLRSKAKRSVADIFEAISVNKLAIDLCPEDASADLQVLQENEVLFEEYRASFCRASRQKTS
ncbi:hypothetical protein FA13DRAFT_1739213 [Coprinellus micaceus]|uniref:Nephrocystin 3-like N-terminal domain-containing protein n=1 Tax=Coprinellus micaceus TaxID=71717 RepID=A0A4Y7SRU4_COPMI|nr:hypothetical protein FA13DRAFT_1739213 [Coprinellus micaceus]